MEALEVDDISPALEVTEDFFSTFDAKRENVQPPEVYGVQEVPELVGHEVFNRIAACGDLRNITLGKTNLVWEHCKNGLLETKVQTAIPAKEQFGVQRGMVPDNLSWVERGEASAFNICQRRRGRPRSVNDIIVQSEETATFKPGHNRSRSDVSHIDWGVILADASSQQPSNQDNRCPKLSFAPTGFEKGEDIQGNSGECLILCYTWLPSSSSFGSYLFSKAESDRFGEATQSQVGLGAVNLQNSVPNSHHGLQRLSQASCPFLNLKSRGTQLELRL